MTQTLTLNERDNKCIWHPFTQHGIEKDFLPIKSAQGAWITLEDDRKILDGISSWWANLHGHSHPAIVDAISEQVKKFSHVLFAGFTHEPAVALAEALSNDLQKKGTKLSRCFYSDNGSTAVEAAMKMAYQYQKIMGKKNRTKFLSLSNAYHGDTLGSMTVSERGNFHHYFSELLPQVDFVNDLASLEKTLDENPETYAAFIVEPIIQASYGMVMYPVELLKAMVSMCQERDILVICDEVFTGFYRTGKCFALEHANIKPDMMCLSKGLTGGFLPLSLVMTTVEIFEAFRSDDVGRAFLHGHTFTGNPISCAAALASWKLLQQEETLSAIQRIVERTKTWVERLSQHPMAENARALGIVGAVDMAGYSNYYAHNYFSRLPYNIRSFTLEHNVLLRPLGKTLYAIPPYCVTEDEVDKIYQTIELILDNLDTLK